MTRILTKHSRWQELTFGDRQLRVSVTENGKIDVACLFDGLPVAFPPLSVDVAEHLWSMLGWALLESQRKDR